MSRVWVWVIKTLPKLYTIKNVYYLLGNAYTCERNDENVLECIEQVCVFRNWRNWLQKNSFRYFLISSMS